MKLSIIPIIFTVFLSIVAYIAGQHFYRDLVLLFIPHIEGYMFFASDQSFFVRDARWMASILALIPVSSFLIWNFSPVISESKKILSVILIIGCMLAGGFLRGKYIRAQITGPPPFYHGNNRPLNTSRDPYTLEELNFKKYLFIGLLFGSAISFFAFREKNSMDYTTKPQKRKVRNNK